MMLQEHDTTQRAPAESEERQRTADGGASPPATAQGAAPKADEASARPAGAARPREGDAGRVNLDPDSVRNGVAQLVLALVKFLHELLERQAVRRMDAGTLTDEQVERLGVALMKQGEQLERMRKEFGLEEEDLNLDLGPLGKLV